MSTEIKLIDNAGNMEVEGGTQVSVQHRDKTQCSGHDNGHRKGEETALDEVDDQPREER